MRALMSFFLLLCSVPLFALLVLSPLNVAAQGVKVQFKGDASTYNPNLPGWKTGGQGLATGGRYNPNEYEAALQLDLARKHGCGYGSKKTCFALVQTSDNRSAIVKINDNGPLVPGRVIDLNEKSMQYLSNGKYGRNNGVLRGVTVALLDGNNHKLGPVDEKDRAEWAKKMMDTPTDAPTPTSYASPSGSPTASPTAQPLSSAYQNNQPPQGSQTGFSSPQGAAQPGQLLTPTSLSPFPGLSLFPHSTSTASSSADKLLGLLGTSKEADFYFEGVDIGTTTLSVSEMLKAKSQVAETSGKFGVTFSASTTGGKEKTNDTFGEAKSGTTSTSAATSSSALLVTALIQLRDILTGILDSLKSLLKMR